MEARLFVSSASVSTGRGSLRFFQLTEKGAEILRALDEDVSTYRRGSPTHEYWRQRLAERYHEQGYEIEFEAPIGGGKTVDLVAMRDGERIAIEVETGKSDAAGNVEKCLAAGFEKVVVFDVNGGAEETLKAALSGDATPGRVVIARPRDLAPRERV